MTLKELIEELRQFIELYGENVEVVTFDSEDGVWSEPTLSGGPEKKGGEVTVRIL